MGSGAGVGLEKQERLEAKRLTKKLFKNSGVGVIGIEKRSYLGDFFFNGIELTDLGKQYYG